MSKDRLRHVKYLYGPILKPQRGEPGTAAAAAKRNGSDFHALSFLWSLPVSAQTPSPAFKTAHLLCFSFLLLPRLDIDSIHLEEMILPPPFLHRLNNSKRQFQGFQRCFGTRFSWIWWSLRVTHPRWDWTRYLITEDGFTVRSVTSGVLPISSRPWRHGWCFRLRFGTILTWSEAAILNPQSCGCWWRAAADLKETPRVLDKLLCVLSERHFKQANVRNQTLYRELALWFFLSWWQ